MKKNTKHSPEQCLPKKKSPLMTAMRALLIVLTLIFPVLMVMLSGAGLVYNSDSYGADITQTGIMLIVAGALMTVGTVLVCLKKDVISLVFSISGFALCMTMLYKLVNHADAAGWQNAHTMEPISDMYFSRIIPTIAPFILAVAIALIHFFSYEAGEKRRLKKALKEEKENAPAPPII